MMLFPALFALFALASCPGIPDEPAELARHQGTWRVVAFRSDGQDTSEETARSITREVLEDHVTWYRNGKAFAGTTIRLDPACQPKAIDVIPDGGPQRGQAVLGIYRLDGDELEICMASPGRPRPSAFQAGPGSGQTWMKFRRERSESRRKPSS